MKNKLYAVMGICAALFFLSRYAQAADEGEIAKKLANPVAALISVPIQTNYDHDVGYKYKGNRMLVNIQPVIPFSLTENWNLISRTILPIVYMHHASPLDEKIFGTSDTEQSLFFSPKEPTANGIIWGVGPIFLLPTASDNLLGSEKWGAGPTGVILRQDGAWTYGVLANFIHSFAGSDNRSQVRQAYVEPFLAYVTKTRTTFSLNTESDYNWQIRKWSIPFNFTISQLLRVGKQLVQVGAGARYWAKTPEGGPRGWGARFTVTFLFPEK